MKIITTFLWLFFFFITSQLSHAQTRQADSLALVMLYDSTGGPNWTTTWDLNQPMDNWNGVGIMNDRVVSLALVNKNLVGSLPDLHLSALTDLGLSLNKLSGVIQDFVNMPNLRSLLLKNNQFSGGVPNFSNLPLLEELELAANQLVGSIPNFSHLPQLQRLSLMTNQLTGNIPNFTSIPLLAKLYLNHNQLTGGIPDFNSIPLLTDLHLEQNQLTGVVPDFSNLPIIENIYLSRNQLTGNLPDFSHMPQLRRLVIRTNSLTGVIPNFSQLPALYVLDLAYNQLSGAIPNFNNVPVLTILYLQDNQLSGNIPDFNNLPLVQGIYLSNNQLTGVIPSFSNLTTLVELQLKNNLLTGVIPEFNHMGNLSRLMLDNNQLSGIVPSFSSCPLSNLQLHVNKFTFEDLLPTYTTLSARLNNYYYNNQDSVATAQTTNLSVGDSYTIDLGIDDTVSTNIYYWYKNGVLIDSVIGTNEYTITNFQAADAGTYTAKVKNRVVFDQSLISTFSDNNLYLYSRPITLNLTTSINNLSTQSLQLQPNPTQEEVFVAIPNSTQGAFEVQVINLQGQVVQQEQGNGENLFRISLQEQPAGVYVIQLIQGGKVWQEKVVKQ